MNRYALWQSSHAKSKKITHRPTTLPSYETADKVVVVASTNTIYRYDEVNCWLYTAKAIDKQALYRLFMQLKKQAMATLKKTGKTATVVADLPSEWGKK